MLFTGLFIIFWRAFYVTAFEAKLLSCLLLSGWDTDLATEAYRQQVEALAQHQVSKVKLYLTYIVGLVDSAG